MSTRTDLSSPQISREGGLPVFFYPVLLLLLLATAAGLLMEFPPTWLWALQTVAVLATFYLVGLAMAMQRNDARILQLQLDELTQRRGDRPVQRPPSAERPAGVEAGPGQRREGRDRPLPRERRPDAPRPASVPAPDAADATAPPAGEDRPRRSSRSRRRRKQPGGDQ